MSFSGNCHEKFVVILSNFCNIILLHTQDKVLADCKLQVKCSVNVDNRL